MISAGSGNILSWRLIMRYFRRSVHNDHSQHSHSHFDLGVHVPLGFSIWGYRSLFEGTHILGELNALLSTGKTLYFKCHCGQF